MCIVLAILLAVGNSGWVVADNDGKVQDVSEDKENLKLRKTDQQKKKNIWNLLEWREVQMER